MYGISSPSDDDADMPFDEEADSSREEAELAAAQAASAGARPIEDEEIDLLPPQSSDARTSSKRKTPFPNTSTAAKVGGRSDGTQKRQKKTSGVDEVIDLT